MSRVSPRTPGGAPRAAIPPTTTIDVSSPLGSRARGTGPEYEFGITIPRPIPVRYRDVRFVTRGATCRRRPAALAVVDDARGRREGGAGPDARAPRRPAIACPWPSRPRRTARARPRRGARAPRGAGAGGREDHGTHCRGRAESERCEASRALPACQVSCDAARGRANLPPGPTKLPASFC